MSTTIDIVPESSNVVKGKAPLIGAPHRPGGWKKGVAIMDFILRLGGVAAALGAAATMATADQTLPFFTQYFQFEASYDSFTTFTFMVIGMALVGGYLVLSLPFSIVTIIRPHAAGVSSSSNSRSCFSCINSILSTQWESKLKLACNL
ncbi:hypothetical protein PIB30_063218 [Stylosanthes scabra]|uniref:CASP-like protein n=1 Tax=Stylosanthes scabra TaxID=79078 RepID=A0ABU6QM15_9FABA|nr:hypothetical protein [Stylosanthes scabra]